MNTRSATSRMCSRDAAGFGIPLSYARSFEEAKWPDSLPYDKQLVTNRSNQTNERSVVCKWHPVCAAADEPTEIKMTRLIAIVCFLSLTAAATAGPSVAIDAPT